MPPIDKPAMIAAPTSALQRSPELISKTDIQINRTMEDVLCGWDAERLQARLAAIVESSDDAIVSKDLNGVIITWNQGAERLFGYTAEEAIGQSISILIPPERLDEEPHILERVRRGERVDHYETVRRRKDGTLLDISLTVSPIITSDGRIVGASKIARDITERKRVEKAVSQYTQQLKEADRRKDEFLATLSHELRNPLAPIRNAIGIMKSLGPLEPKLEWCRDLIDRQIALMSRLMEDLLDVSRITQDRLVLRKQLIDLREVIKQATEISRPQVEAAKHTLTVDLPSEPLIVDGDPARLTQVFGNLLNNAAKYMKDCGEIRLSASPSNGDQVVVSVKDRGIGIAPETLPQLFNMFFQADNGHERRDGGLGIGLTLAQRLVEMHGGNIEATSEGVDKGSEFTVRLPLARS